MSTKRPFASPILMPVKGGWMAHSAPGSRIGIGVVASTENEAMQRFEIELEAWTRLLEAHERLASVA